MSLLLKLKSHLQRRYAPSIQGLGSVFNLWGNYYEYRYNVDANKADSEALKSDWEAAGDDLRKEIEYFRVNKKLHADAPRSSESPKRRLDERRFFEIRKLLEEQRRQLQEHVRILEDSKRVLDDHDSFLKDYDGILDRLNKLSESSKYIDIDVSKLIDATKLIDGTKPGESSK